VLEIIEHLAQVRGISPWAVEMLLMLRTGGRLPAGRLLRFEERVRARLQAKGVVKLKDLAQYKGQCCKN
jgi:hypothetical protein